MDNDLSQSLENVTSALSTTGFDVHVGRKLYSFARRAGLKNIKVDIAPYHQIVGAADEETMRLWSLKLSIAEPMIETALGNKTEAQRCCALFLDHLKDPDTVTYSVVFTVTGEVAG